MKRSLRSQYRGVTLVELILTMVILGIVAVPLTLMLYEHVEGVFLSSDQMLAAQLGRREMERQNNMAYDSLLTASQSNYQGYPFDVDTTVSYVYGNASSVESLKSVQVEVTKHGSSDVLANYITYRVKNVQFGV
ncbi:MAG: prepilin-type N-terminal cleavage/methylation domain-containing protein [Candidatus Omnitrophota bacterium]